MPAICWPHRSQASEDESSEGSPANSGDEQAPPEAVPATSQSPALDPTLFTNFSSFGFSAPPLNLPLSRSVTEGEEGRRLGGEAERRVREPRSCYMSACALGHLCCLVACTCACGAVLGHLAVLGRACQSCTTTLQGARVAFRVGG